MQIVNELFDGVPSKTTETVEQYMRWVHFSEQGIERPFDEQGVIEKQQLLGMLTEGGRLSYVLVIQSPSNPKEYIFYQYSKGLELALIIFDGCSMEIDKNGDIEKERFFQNTIAIAFSNKNDAMQAKMTFEDSVKYHEL